MRVSSILVSAALLMLVACGGSSSSDETPPTHATPQVVADGAGGAWIAVQADRIDSNGSAVGFVAHVTVDGQVDKKRDVPYAARLGPVAATSDALTILVDDATRHGYFDALTDAPREQPATPAAPQPVSAGDRSVVPVFSATDEAGRGHVVALLEVGAVPASIRPMNSRVTNPSYDRVLVRTTGSDATTLSDQIFDGASLGSTSVSMTKKGELALGLPNRVLGLAADGTTRFDVAIPFALAYGPSTLARPDGSAFAFVQSRFVRVEASGAVGADRTVDFEFGPAVLSNEGVIVVSGEAETMRAIRLDANGNDMWRTTPLRP